MPEILINAFKKTSEYGQEEKLNLTRYLQEDVDAVIFRVVDFNRRDF